MRVALVLLAACALDAAAQASGAGTAAAGSSSKAESLLGRARIADVTGAFAV